MEAKNAAVTKWILLLGLATFVALCVGCGSKSTSSTVSTPPLGKVSGDFRINNFGWRSADTKMAVLLGHGNETAQLIRSTDNSVAATYTASAVQTEGLYSGDIYSTVDFSAFNTSGDYYLYLPTSNIRSYDFKIADNVYDIVGAVALKSYYYQRCNRDKTAKDKTTAYATDALGGFAGHGSQWVDGVCHISDKSVKAATGVGLTDDGSLDLLGGWHDAGDYSKDLWDRGVPAMLFAYEMNPTVWKDGQTNIPESGNGIPDLLDEVQWELDFYVKMQRPPPDGHFISTVSAIWAASTTFSPPSQSNEPRLYYDGSLTNGCATPPCPISITTATATGNAVLSLAHAAIVFKAAAGQTSGQAATALTTTASKYFAAATSGWTWLTKTALPPAGTLSVKENQLKAAAAAAVFRMDPTNASAQLVADGFAWDTWGGLITAVNATPGENVISLGAWHYLLNTSGTPSVKTKVRTGIDGAIVDTAFTVTALNADGPYGSMFGNSSNGWDWDWGSNREQGNYGFNLMMAVKTMAVGQTTLGTNSPPNTKARTPAEVTLLAQKHLHFLLGLNPLNMVYLTNMAAYGGEHSSFQMYHGWFSYNGKDGDNGNPQYNGKPTWVNEPLYPYYVDDTQTSIYGPAPGLVVGGPKLSYTGSYIIPKKNFPAYAYRDFSVATGTIGASGVGAVSYELTEPDVAYQGPFLALVSFFM